MNPEKSSVSAEKDFWRREIRARLGRLSAAERQVAADRWNHKFESYLPWGTSRRIGLFWPLASELDIRPVWRLAARENLEVAAPAWDPATEGYRWRRVRDPKGEFVSGIFGVTEPSSRCPEVPPCELEWVLVPGMAFDASGGRLGRGKGFYDRLLRQSPQAAWLGVAFDEQMIEKVPLEPHDVRLHDVMTPAGWVVCQTGRK